MFKKKNSLPRPKEKMAFVERDGFARARQRHLDVARHIVRPLERVGEMRIVLRHEAVEPRIEIAARGGVGVFHDDEAATRVAAEKRRDPALQPAAREFAGHGRGELVHAGGPGIDAQSGLVYSHAESF